jgi:hypothetical protein
MEKPVTQLSSAVSAIAPSNRVTQPYNAATDIPGILTSPNSGFDVPHHERSEVIDWPLANGGFTQISRADLDVVSRYKWLGLHTNGQVYVYARINGTRVYMHRLLGHGHSTWDRVRCKWVACDQVDHRDRNTVNNTQSNLRICSPQANQANGIGRPTARRSRFKGVAFYKKRKVRPWRTTITVNGRQIHGGYFDSEEEAARCYDGMARRYFGEFARTNNA